MGLSYIVSGIGRPLGLDHVTEDTCRLGTGQIGYARVLVKVDAEDGFFKMLEVGTPCEESGVERLMPVHVESQWKPSRCIKCKVFGHFDLNCPLMPKTIFSSSPHSLENQTSVDSEGF